MTGKVIMYVPRQRSTAFSAPSKSKGRVITVVAPFTKPDIRAIPKPTRCAIDDVITTT